MNWIIEFLVTAVVLLGAAKVTPRVEMRDFKTALVVALVIGILSVLVGWLLTLVVNVATLGIFWFTGLGIVTRTIANAIVIEIADAMSKGFKTRGFMVSLLLAIVIAIISSLVSAVLNPEGEPVMD
ncbi:MAG: phage holin family protein [Bacteroidota bacterium]|nr:phage holin family protein [Bacteroidota bacterium]